MGPLDMTDSHLIKTGNTGMGEEYPKGFRNTVKRLKNRGKHPLTRAFFCAIDFSISGSCI